MVGGVAERSESEATPQHSVVPNNEEEFEIFLNRLVDVSQGVLRLKDWELLLTACDRLIPLKPESPQEVEPSLAEMMLELLGGDFLAERVEPVELDLEAFACTWKGRIIQAVLTGFAAKSTLQNSQRFTSDEWLRLLTRFYDLSAYLSPPIYPIFTKDLCKDLEKSLESIRLANLISSAEPLVAKQRINRATLDDWGEWLGSEIGYLKDQGKGFGEGDDPNEFDDWRSRSKKLLDTAVDFASWGTIEHIGEVEELKNVLESAERPHEFDPDSYDEPQREVLGPYWTVQRLFEDL